jgi:hypothetical protein
MPQDVFGRTVAAYGGSFAADTARLVFNAAPSSGLLVQNINFQYSQNITRLYDLGDNKVYYVGGRTQGQLSIARVIGPRVLLAQFYAQYGDVCKARGNMAMFEMERGCEGSTFNYTMMYCVITTIGVSAAAADMVINEQSTMMFSSMTYEEGGGVANAPAGAAGNNGFGQVGQAGAVV